MFTRVVEITAKAGKSRELATTLNEKIVPILKKQRGFVDEIVLLSDSDPSRVFAMSFWNMKDDADRYNREEYPKIHDSLRYLLETDPIVRTFDVHTFVGQKIAAGKAA